MGKDKKINWSLYNKSLVNRGQITFLFSSDIVKSWYAKRSSKQGCQQVYSDKAIETLNTLRFVFGLRLRSTEGFARSLAKLAGLDIEIPNYTTLCRRLQKLSVKLQKSYLLKSVFILSLIPLVLKFMEKGNGKSVSMDTLREGYGRSYI